MIKILAKAVCAALLSAAPCSAAINITATIFPVYDFTRQIAGTKAAVTLLIPPGINTHSYEPGAGDIKNLSRADLFIYSSEYMEPWAPKMAKAAGVKPKNIAEAGRGIPFDIDSAEDHDGHDSHHHHHGEKDPHIWTDLSKAAQMVDNIASALAERDPENRAYYSANAAEYKKRLSALDAEFKATLASCKTKNFVHIGHNAFEYPAKRYGLRFITAQGLKGDSEPSPKTMMALIKTVRDSKSRYIFSEEMLNRRFANTIAEETGAKILLLYPGHNISRQDFISGANYISFMKKNLANLAEGLECSR